MTIVFQKIAAKVDKFAGMVGFVAVTSFFATLFSVFSEARYSFLACLVMMWSSGLWFLWHIYAPGEVELVDDEFIRQSVYDKCGKNMRRFYVLFHTYWFALLILWTISLLYTTFC